MARRTRIAAISLVAALAPIAADSGEARKRSACQRLRGEDLAPARTVKLVERSTDRYLEETDLLGCVLPRGRVRLIANASEAETSSSSYSIRSITGAFVATSTSSGSQYGFGSGTQVTSIRTGRAYSISSAGCSINESCSAGPEVRPVHVTGNGRAAAALTENQTTTIAVFSTTGRRTDLDSGPSDQVIAGSLRLHGATVTWTGTGGARSARLPSGA